MVEAICDRNNLSGSGKTFHQRDIRGEYKWEIPVSGHLINNNTLILFFL